MTRFEDAWAWYRATAESCQLLGQLAGWWRQLPEWDASTLPPPTGQLRLMLGQDILKLRDKVSSSLNDLAVLFLFSVFEATVRDFVRAQVDPEVQNLQHVALQKAGKELQDTVDEGSFAKVLALVKVVDPHLTEQVSQIRQHRNWLAHGKKPGKEPRNRVGEPREVYLRLKSFLDLLQGLAK